MKEFVADMVIVVRGESGAGAYSRHVAPATVARGRKLSPPAAHALSGSKSTSKSLAFTGKSGKIAKAVAKIVNPEKVIPMGDDFNAF